MSRAQMEPSRRGAAIACRVVRRPLPRPVSITHRRVCRWEGKMEELKIVHLHETESVKFGPDAVYQLILGDDEGTTPIRTGIQTSQPGYAAPVHSHPYMEVLRSEEHTSE